MLQNKLKELVATRAKLASLEQAIAAELNKELAGLPAKYGFSAVADFIAAVNSAAGARRGRKPGKAKAAPKAKAVAAPKAKAVAAPKAKAGGKKRRRRAVITDATRADLKKLVEAGKTGREIAKELKISLPSVQNIKKALGLVKKR